MGRRIAIKRCHCCGRGYTSAELERLPFVGAGEMGGEWLRYYACPCGSTLAFEVGGSQ